MCTRANESDSREVERISKARAALPISDLSNLLPSINASCSSSTTQVDSDIQNYRSKFREQKAFELLKSQSISSASMCLLYQPRLYLPSQRLYHMSTAIRFSKFLMSVLCSFANSVESLFKVTKKKIILALQEG